MSGTPFFSRPFSSRTDWIKFFCLRERFGPFPPPGEFLSSPFFPHQYRENEFFLVCCFSGCFLSLPPLHVQYGNARFMLTFLPPLPLFSGNVVRHEGGLVVFFPLVTSAEPVDLYLWRMPANTPYSRFLLSLSRFFRSQRWTELYRVPPFFSS